MVIFWAAYEVMVGLERRRLLSQLPGTRASGQLFCRPFDRRGAAILRRTVPLRPRPRAHRRRIAPLHRYAVLVCARKSRGAPSLAGQRSAALDAAKNRLRRVSTGRRQNGHRSAAIARSLVLARHVGRGAGTVRGAHEVVEERPTARLTRQPAAPNRRSGGATRRSRRGLEIDAGILPRFVVRRLVHRQYLPPLDPEDF